MRLLVVGASGRTGRHVVTQALGHGHEVTALVHSTPLDIEHPRLTVVTGDVRDFEVVRPAVEGQSAVASALGIGGRGAGGVHEAGVANVIHAMAVHEVRKLAVVSAAGAFARTDKNISLAFRAMIATALRSVYDDLEAMEMRVKASSLDWTIVRPYGLSDGPQTGEYRMTRDGGLLKGASRVSRADVAAVLLAALETEEYNRRVLTVGE